jgi:hypothetical protein
MESKIEIARVFASWQLACALPPLIASASCTAPSRLSPVKSATQGGHRMPISSALGLSHAQHRVQLSRAVIAGTVGTIIEAYDFLLYVQVAPLVFAKLYFPSSDPLVGTLQAFGIYAVGFVSRPVGAALFGHFGDRIGRKVTLIATLLLTCQACRPSRLASSRVMPRSGSGAR